MRHKTTAELSASSAPEDQAVLAERNRILRILESHRNHLTGLHARLCAFVNEGADVEDAADDDPRPMGLDWRRKSQS